MGPEIHEHRRGADANRVHSPFGLFVTALLQRSARPALRKFDPNDPDLAKRTVAHHFSQRTRSEQGVRFNEKWIYRNEDDGHVERLVFWNRYDLAGVFRVRPDGSAEPESLPEE